MPYARRSPCCSETSRTALGNSERTSHMRAPWRVSTTGGCVGLFRAQAIRPDSVNTGSNFTTRSTEPARSHSGLRRSASSRAHLTLTMHIIDLGLKDLLDLLQLLAPAALGVAGYYLRQLNVTLDRMSNRIGGVEDELRKLNGRLTRLEEWRSTYERNSEQHDARVHEDIIELRQALREIAA